ncbi:hypothetical protein ELS19_19330 [Halogeometricum borinquense]|uniref:Sulfatase N-terminal domain-containing protein n=1 Tax=Halogeometricum borinquense TaxID=60847 RepID=A0A482SYB1_9EURY|nr:hypothetical protein ELS19_19330 [Halogeometricum borinquense]
MKSRVVDIDQLGGYDPVWKYMPAENPHGTTSLPSHVTDKAIHTARTKSPDRLLIHYMQPHDPFLAHATERGELLEYERRPFDELRAGNVSKDTLWNAYMDNLRFVLDEIKRLLSNIDAEQVLITADHGELFGRILHSHAPGILHPDLRRVPWVRTTARDEETSHPDPITQDESAEETDAEQRLKDLGYL